ncbi:hypothetical protein ABGM91_11400 [Akkermansia muciniphila]|uniref:hypothetical protein n=1 Tax=Akkermansia muciniphila TaxID=239935 RepID=UPI0033BF262B
MDNTEEKNTQTCTPDEACNNPAAEQALVTEEELQKAIDHVVDLVGRYDGRVVVAAFIEGDNTTRRIFRVANEVFASNGMNTKIYGWTGACGFLLKANECFDRNAKTMGEGVRLFLEQQQKEKMKRQMNPIAAMLGFTGCVCEECED